MSDLVLAGAGVIVFALTTWASLVFGYQVFQTSWEMDQDQADPLGAADEVPAVPSHPAA